MVRKVFGYDNKNNGRACAVFYDFDYEEYVVKFYEEGKYLPDADYFSDDKIDAIDTGCVFCNKPSALRECAALTDLF
jgi:hypothetical protein